MRTKESFQSKQVVRRWRVTILLLMFVLLFNAVDAISPHSVTTAAPSASCGTAAGDLGGLVWSDLDSDGVKDAGEPAFDGTNNGPITVSAYDRNGLVTTVGVGTDGTYNFDDIFAGRTGDEANIRLEFTGLPTGIVSGAQGNDSGTSVQFFSTAMCNADIALQNPDAYIDPNPRLATNVYIAGNPTGGTTENQEALVSFPYDASGQRFNGGTAASSDATQGDIGATWGLAFKRDTQQLFSSAVVKRHTGLKHGTGAIFVTDYSDDTPTTSLWLDLNGLGGINTGADPHSGLTGNYQDQTYDTNAFDAVGKISLGDLDISDDGQTLYAVNLNSKQLISIDIASKTVSSAVAIPDPGCMNSGPKVAGAFMFGLDAIPGRSIAGFEDGAAYVAASSYYDAGQIDRMITNTTSAPDNLFNFYVSPNSGKLIDIAIPFTDLGISVGTQVDVTLYFYAYSTITAPEQRKFNVNLEGTTEGVVDMWVDSGNTNLTPFERTFSTTVAGAYLNIALDGNPYGSSSEPRFSGMKIERTGVSAVSAPADSRPWALDVENGSVYVGVTCSAQSSGFREDLSATVYSYDGTTFDPILAIPLTYTKGRAYDISNIYDPNYLHRTTRGWYPWLSNLYQIPRELAADETDNPDQWSMQYPQPILADLIVNENQELIMGFIDRFGHQMGWSNYGTFVGETNPIYIGQAEGDILKACYTGSGYVLEGDPACPQPHNNVRWDGTAFVLTGAPEFFDDQSPLFPGDEYSVHEEMNMGGLAQLEGSSEIVSVIIDPLALRSNGVRTWDMTTGDTVNNYEIAIDPDNAGFGSPAGNFSKAGGLGDLELLMTLAPIEIGNRVWVDSDADGIQDPEEGVLNGVSVTLWADTDGDDIVDTQVGTAVTDSNGNYHFGGAGDANMETGYSVEANTVYEIRINSGQSALDGYVLTPTQNAAQPANGNLPATDNDPISDVADSDAAMSGSMAVITLTTGDAGENNHGLDFGFLEPVSIGSVIWDDSASPNGTYDNGTDTPIDGATVTLLNSDGSPAVDLDGNAVTTSTGADGLYYFDNLAPGAYIVEVTPPAGYAPAPNQNGGDDQVENDSNIDTGATTAAGTWQSGVITLTAGGEPTESGTLPGDDADNGADTNGDMTVDFGFLEPVSIGSVIWDDSASPNGTYDNGTDTPIDGATVTLLNSDGSPAVDLDGNAVTTSTGADGLYYFDNLAPGAYIVEVTPPSNFEPTINQNGNDDGVENDSNIDMTATTALDTWQSGVITLTAGGEPTESGTLPGDDADNGADTNGDMTVDFGFKEKIPTATSIAFVNAVSGEQQITLMWATVSEETMDYFNVYRSTSPYQVGEQLNAEPIVAQNSGLPEGSSYDFADDQVLSGIQYYYTLEVWDVDGTAQSIGPVLGVLESPTAINLDTFNATQSEMSLMTLLTAGMLALAGIGWHRRRNA